VAESFTCTVKADVVESAAGVPLIAPVDVLSDRPAGSVPVVTVHVYGAVPPAAARAVLVGYAAPIVPLGSDVVVTDSGVDAAPIVILRFAVDVAEGVAESLTCTVKRDVVALAAGVPVIAPVFGLRVRPAGKVPVVRDQV